MRRAMKEPALLVVALESGGAEALGADVEAAVVGALQESGGAPFGPALRGPDGGALVLWTSWSTGEAAKAAWASLVTSAAWPAVAEGLAGQPAVHVAAWDGRGWPEGLGGALVAFEVTADATVQTRADRRRGGRPKATLASFEELPQVEGGLVAAAIGHTGRLVGLAPAASWPRAAEALEAAWGPWVEGPRVWRVEAG